MASAYALSGLAHIFLVSFIVGTADLQFLSNPSGPSPTVYILVSVVTVLGFAAIVLLTIFGADDSIADMSQGVASRASPRRRLMFRGRSGYLAIGAIILPAVLIVELAVVPVGHYTPVGPSTYGFNVGGLKNWSDEVTLKDLGQLVFNWTEEAGYSENLEVTLTRGNGPSLYSASAPSGYEGLVVGPGTYTLTAAQPQAQTLVGFSMTVQAGWYSSSPLLEL